MKESQKKTYYLYLSILYILSIFIYLLYSSLYKKSRVPFITREWLDPILVIFD